MSGRLRMDAQLARKAKAAGPKVVLVMIVRDEAPILRGRLEAIRDQLDGWCIVDTGSTDQTREIAQEVLRDLPGHVFDRPWSGFAAARTEAVALAARDFPGAWALLLDADTIFKAAPGWRKVLDHAREVGYQAVSCDVEHGSIRYSHPRLLLLGAAEWRWRGVLHEYLVPPAGTAQGMTELITVEHGAGGARSRNPRKYADDALILQRARRENEEPDLAARYTFYEAQSWRDAGRHDVAERTYEERALMGGWAQEVYLSWLNVGEIRLAQGELAGAYEAFTRAYGADPDRAEALVGMATICRTWESWAPAFTFARFAQGLAPTSGGMFADRNVGWRADFEASVAAWYLGRFEEGKVYCEQVLASELASPAVKDRTRANLALYEAAL